MKTTEIEILKNGQQFFKQYFINHKVVYLYIKDGQLKHFVVSMSKANFMHLCGVSYKHGPKSFYDGLKRNQLKLNLITFKEDGTSRQKISALSMIEELINTNVRVCEQGRYLHLSFDRALRSNKNLVALTLISKQAQFLPNSLLNLKSSKPIGFPISYEVVHVFKVSNITKEKQIVLPCKDEYLKKVDSYLFGITI
ncbi:hypothetical protein HCA93_14125 [Listeria innocua]|uniref:PBECR4 domain-containing protein n=1 Tax=Listeria innocua TaxID=1642 RepID=UPI00162696F8|nr:PBECR4 domain-containing protein [Listeria innocua]MBC2137438.1 hypothetical protein [Listeria innocua]